MATKSYATNPIVIAHRGASGYLPEHTLAAKAVAHTMGADFLEQDVVLSRDGVPLVLHDIYLDATTDVALKYPGRAREDGRYYALDFDLEEVRRLQVHERRQHTPETAAVYPGRFPVEPALFGVPTLAEELDLIAGMDKSTGRTTGIYLEFKAPNWHQAQGSDPVPATLAVLQDKGYAKRPGQVFLQCFDDATLRRLRRELETPLPLIQLIADNSWGEDSAVDYDLLRTPQGLDRVAEYADGIGPWLTHIYRGKDDTGSAMLSDLVALAHERELLVHPYTFRRDELPAGVGSFDELLDIFIGQAAIDGLFTDFPDLARDYLRSRDISR